MAFVFDLQLASMLGLYTPSHHDTTCPRSIRPSVSLQCVHDCCNMGYACENGGIPPATPMVYTVAYPFIIIAIHSAMVKKCRKEN
jgi:hypothetical protein